MCNCNQQRMQYSSAGSVQQNGMIRVQLLAETPLSINGNVTGRMYIFRNKGDFLWVDKRDAPYMKEVAGLDVQL